MVNYKCSICKYETNNKFNYNKHSLTSKHIKLVKDNDLLTNKLEFENNILKEKLKFMEIHEKKYDKLLKKCISNKDEIINNKDEIIKICKEDKNAFSNIAKKSVSALSYIIKNYPNAPNIEIFSNFDFLKEPDNYKLANSLLYQYKNKTLIPFIIDILIKHYKKTNLDEQSIWNTDVNRLSYLIKNNDNIKKISNWTIDKKGILLTSYVVQPIIDKLKIRIDDIMNIIKKDSKQIINKVNKTNDDYDKIIYTNELMQQCIEFQKELENDYFTNEILKNISKHFYYNGKQLIEYFT